MKRTPSSARPSPDVKPLKRHKRVALEAPAPLPVPHQRRRDEAAALAESLRGPLTVEEALETGEELSYLRDGMARETLRKLRRGHWAIQDGIDLHGLTRDQAAAIVAEFLDAVPGARPALRAHRARQGPRDPEGQAQEMAAAARGGAGLLPGARERRRERRAAGTA